MLQNLWILTLSMEKKKKNEMKCEIPKWNLIFHWQEKMCSSNIHWVLWKFLMLFSCGRKPQKLCLVQISVGFLLFVLVGSCVDILNDWSNGLAISACAFSWDPNDYWEFVENTCISNETSNWQSMKQSCAQERTLIGLKLSCNVWNWGLTEQLWWYND